MILSAQNLRKYFPVKKGFLKRETGKVHAVDGVSLNIPSQQTVGLVGESGCGKSTLARLLVGLIAPDQGEILFEDQPIAFNNSAEMKQLRRNVQMVFQDNANAFNPRFTVKQILEEPFEIHKPESSINRDERIIEVLSSVGLSDQLLNRYAKQLSGGQRQRVGIARALVLRPKLVILDEPLSSLDLSVQGQILNLLIDLQTQYQLSYLIISHDLRMVRQFCDWVAVMYLGEIVEFGPRQKIFNESYHPYTQSLLESADLKDLAQQQLSIEGEPPSSIHPPSGCRFRTRCSHAKKKCQEPTELTSRGAGHLAACHVFQ